ncbi:MAG: hypothetical protein LCH80_05480 [Proteobacteria bacterium]|jgi:hypothetical protein|nr:hypothetical protein [Pseudomonadota bacterium]
MLQSAFKLFCFGVAMLGPFAAGILHQYVIEPEIYAIFFAGGILLGFGGICGFASIERDETRRFRAALGKKG